MEANKKKKNSKMRFNIIDLVIVVLILACIVGVYLRSISVKDLDTEETLDTAQISFLVQDIRYTSADFFIGGEKVYTKEDGLKIGEFMKGYFVITPAEDYVTDHKGNTVKVTYPENTRIDVKGKILSEGKWTDGGFLVGGNTYIAAGKEMKICTSHITVTLVVTDVAKNIES